jgi:cysteine desulfurase/selenocysteine lyase
LGRSARLQSFSRLNAVSVPMVLKYKDEWPLLKGKIHFDTATTGAMPASTIKVLGEYVQTVQKMFRGELPWQTGTSEYADRRLNSKKLFAEVIGGREEEVAFVPNATAGINTAINMVPVKRGQNIVCTNLSFPMGATIVNKQRDRGAKPKWLKNKKGVVALEQFEKAVNDRTAAVVVDQPSWFNGYLHDLKALSEVCRGHGAKLIVDGTQSIGSLAWEADRWGVDFAATSTYKWIMGGHYGQSAGFMFVSKPNIDATQPVYVGEKTLEPSIGERNTFDEFTLYDFKPRKGLERVEVFARQEISYVAAENSMKVLLAHGKKAVERQVRDVDNALVEELTKRHFRLQTPKEEERRIYVNVQVPDFKVVGEKLMARNVHVAARIGGLRLSPHFYNTEDEAVELVKVLREVTKTR